MTEFPREFIKKDPDVMGKIHALILSKHQCPEFVERELKENKHIEGFTILTTQFVFMGKNLYLSYNYTAWLNPENHGKTIAVCVESITIYDGFLEYEKTRFKALNSAKIKDSEQGRHN